MRLFFYNVGGIYTFADVPVGQYSVQVNVTGTGGVTVPPVAVRVMRALYLPSISR